MVTTINIKDKETVIQLMNMKYALGLKTLEETINFLREEYNKTHQANKVDNVIT
jgi:hypothetical protein